MGITTINIYMDGLREKLDSGACVADPCIKSPTGHHAMKVSAGTLIDDDYLKCFRCMYCGWTNCPKKTMSRKKIPKKP
jgi:hypothetical protein